MQIVAAVVDEGLEIFRIRNHRAICIKKISGGNVVAEMLFPTYALGIICPEICEA